MAIEIGALRAMLSLDSAAFHKGVKRAEASMNRLQRAMTRAANKMRTTGRRLTLGVTTPAVAATGLLVKNSLATIDAQAKQAESMETSVRSLQVLSRAADLAGISQGELEGSMTRLTRRISLAAQGMGPGKKALDRLKLSAEDFTDLDMDDRIKLIQERLQQFIPEAERAGVASQLFGDRTGLAMTRLNADVIRQASDEVQRFGVAVSDVDADQIERTNDAVSALGLVFRGLGNQIAVALAPTIEAIAERVADLASWFSSLDPKVKTFVATAATIGVALGPALVALGLLATGLAAVATPVGLVTAALVGIGTAAAAVALYWDDLTAKYPGLKTAFETIKTVAGAVASLFRDQLQTSVAVISEAFRALADFLRGDFSAAWQHVKNAAQAVVDYFASMGDAIRGYIADIAAAVSEIGPAIVGALKGVVESVKQEAAAIGKALIDGITGGIDGGSAAAAQAARRATANAARASRKEAETNSPSKVFARIGDDMMRGMTVGIERTGKRAAAAAALTTEEAATASRQIAASLDVAAPTGPSQLEQSVQGLNSSIGQAIANGRDLGATLEQSFRQIAASWITNGLNQIMATAFGGGATGAGAGGFLSGIFGGFRANGGSVMAGKAYVVGERGPELYMPSNAGKIIPNAALSSKGAEIVVRSDPGVIVEVAQGVVREERRGIVGDAVAATRAHAGEFAFR